MIDWNYYLSTDTTQKNSSEVIEKRIKLYEDLLHDYFFSNGKKADTGDVFYREGLANYMYKCRELISPLKNPVVNQDTRFHYCNLKEDRAKKMTESFLKELAKKLATVDDYHLKDIPSKNPENIKFEYNGSSYTYTYSTYGTHLQINFYLNINRGKATLSIQHEYDYIVKDIDFETFKKLIPSEKLYGLKRQIEIADKHGIDISQIPEELQPKREATTESPTKGAQSCTINKNEGFDR